MAECIDKNSQKPHGDTRNEDQDVDIEEIVLIKRLSKDMPKRKNDFYVSKNTDFKNQIARCHKLLDSGWNELYIHGLGAAVNRAINIALQLKALSNGSLDVSVHTSSVELVDDIEPYSEQHEPEIQTRNNSAVHIKVFHPEKPLPHGIGGTCPSPVIDHTEGHVENVD